jgi:hypothetical protein
MNKKMEHNTPFELPTFNGYIIDKRLGQFRKAIRGESPKIEFIDFNSKKGQALLEEMQEYFSFLFEEGPEIFFVPSKKNSP